MYDIILFGGTTEGRLLAGYLSDKSIKTLVCTATEYGGELVNITSSSITITTGRKDESEIRALLKIHRPRLVIDATHPYASDVTKNLRSACEAEKSEYLRVLRERRSVDGCTEAADMDELISLLNAGSGVIFSALGAKEAAALTKVKDYNSRVFLRILPQPAALETCLELGYAPSNIICMQGPFSQEINRAMFQAAKAEILVTKESGAAGGFEEKLRAASDLNMETIVLRRPTEAEGLSLSEAYGKIGELFK